MMIDRVRSNYLWIRFLIFCGKFKSFDRIVSVYRDQLVFVCFVGIRTSLSETPPGKSSPATPKVARLSRAANKSETTSPSSRLSLDRSSPSSKSTSVERRSPKVPTPPEVISL